MPFLEECIIIHWTMMQMHAGTLHYLVGLLVCDYDHLSCPSYHYAI